MPVVQVGMPGSIPDEVRQDIIAPLQDLPNVLEVCPSESNSVTAHRVICAACAVKCINSIVGE